MKTIRTVLFLIFCACISGAQTHTGGGFTPGGSAAAGGSNTQGQYNNNGVLGGSAGLTMSSTQVTGMTTTCQPGEALVAGASGVNACSAVPNGTTPPTTTTNIGTANLAITVPNEAVTGTALNCVSGLFFHDHKWVGSLNAIILVNRKAHPEAAGGTSESQCYPK